MPKDIPLDEQIVATLTGLCTSDQASAVLADARTLHADLKREADSADVASLSPLATAAEARKHRDTANDRRFELDRLEASISALEARVADLLDAERKAAREARLIEVKAERDALAADIAIYYPAAVETLTGLAKRIVENDARLREVGLTHSSEWAETIGRGLPDGAGFGDQRSSGFEVARRIPDIEIQMPASKHLAWYNDQNGWNWPGLDCAADA